MTSNAPLISVCIANYNGMAVIDDCLQSVLVHKGDLNVEILVHDDASTDGSIAHIQANYPDILLIESDKNVGFCIANNRIVAMAKGQFILLLNNDAALHPEALQVLLQEAGRLQRPAILTLPQYDATSGALVDRGCLLDPFYNPVPNLAPNRADVAMVIGACLWIPKNLWDELEGFPEWFESIAEDMHLCCRARLAGYAVRALAVSGYRHWQGASFGGNKPQGRRLNTTFRRRYLSERNKLQVMLLMSPGMQLAWLLPLHLLLSLLETLALCLVRVSWDYGLKVQWPAWQDAWRRRILLIQKRRHLQALRRATARDYGLAFTRLPRKLALLWQYGLPRLR